SGPANLKGSNDSGHLLVGLDLDEVRDALLHQDALPALIGGGDPRRVGAVDGPRVVGAGRLAGEVEVLHRCGEPRRHVGRLPDQVARVGTQRVRVRTPA
ncbi:Os04g0671250, partial [Oryza sativa Japonica Group]